MLLGTWQEGIFKLLRQPREPMSIPTLKGSYQVRGHAPSPAQVFSSWPFEFLLHLLQLQPALPIPSPGAMLIGPVSCQVGEVLPGHTSHLVLWGLGPPSILLWVLFLSIFVRMGSPDRPGSAQFVTHP